MIPGIDTPLSPFAGGEVRVEEGGDGRSKQILIAAASVIAVLIIVGRMRIASAPSSTSSRKPSQSAQRARRLARAVGPSAQPSTTSGSPCPSTRVLHRPARGGAPVPSTDLDAPFQQRLLDAWLGAPRTHRRGASPRRCSSIRLYWRAMEPLRSPAARDALFERAD